MRTDLIAVPAPRTVHRRDIFLEGCATRSYTVYRAHHRPTGLVVELTFPRGPHGLHGGSQPPPYTEIVERLLCEMMRVLYNLPADGPPEEGPYYAPVA